MTKLSTILKLITLLYVLALSTHLTIYKFSNIDMTETRVFVDNWGYILIAFILAILIGLTDKDKNI
jgi:hypothetical protein